MKTFILLLLFTSITYASDWTGTDTALELTYAAAHVVDWSQTRYMSRNWDTPITTVRQGRTDFEYRREGNLILGTTPHRDTVDLYFAGTLAAHAVVSYLLPKPYRTYWQGITIGFQSGVVAHNINAGVRVRF